MRPIYEETRIPVQIRRLMVFDEMCRLAKSKPDQIVHLSPYTQLSFGVMYLQDFKKFIAFGGMFEYVHTREDVIEQGIAIIPNDELVMCALTVKLKAFTPPARNAVQWLWQWNNYVKNRMHAYVDYCEEHFLKLTTSLIGSIQRISFISVSLRLRDCHYGMIGQSLLPMCTVTKKDSQYLNAITRRA